jgi:hypothetical protein
MRSARDMVWTKLRHMTNFLTVKNLSGVAILFISYLCSSWKKDEKKGYFIINNILHVINHNYLVTHTNSKPVVPLKSQDIDPRLLSESKLPVESSAWWLT